MSRSLKHTVLFAGFFVLLLVFFLLDLFTGSVAIPAVESVRILFTGQSSHPEWVTILYDFRLPRAATAILAGIALSLSGLQMQTLFRNPLAGPYVLGISSGASLGVALLVMGAYVFFPAQNLEFRTWGIIGAACMGSGLVMLLILLVSMRIKDVTTILILGILFGSISIAIVSILQFFTSEALLKTFIVWTLGSLGNITGDQLWVICLCVIVGFVLSLSTLKVLNAFLLGENYARSLGMPVRTGQVLIFISTSILAGSITAFCGPIGFIGIVVPHIVRLIWRTSDHRVLIPGVMITGAILLLVSDMISQLPGSERVLPINSVTALLGIPVVIWIIIRNQRFTRVS